MRDGGDYNMKDEKNPDPNTVHPIAGYDICSGIWQFKKVKKVI